MKKLSLFLLAAVSLPFLASSQLMPKLAKDGVELYVGIGANYTWGDGVFSTDSAGIYKLPAGYGGNICFKAPVMVSGGITYHNGKIYVNSYDDTNGFEWMLVPQWRIYDLRTGELEKAIDGDDNLADCTNALTYDISSDKIYGIGQNNNGIYLASIEPETGEKTNIGWLTENGNRLYTCNAIASNRYGMLYTIYESYGNPGTAKFGRINPANGQISFIGDIRCENMLEGDGLMMMSSRHALIFNHESNKLYWIHTGSSLTAGDYYMPVFEMNVNTGVATMAGYLPEGNSVTGAFFNEPLLTAPDGVNDLEYIHSPESEDFLTGHLTMTAPSTTYDGDILTGELTIVITDGDEEIERISNVVPGQTITTKERTFQYGEHKFSCCAISADGEESATCEFPMFLGYDLPSNPTNAKLTADGQKITLTWEAPTTGIHGNEIDTENITYLIMRYPEMEIVAENYDQTSYEETVPDELHRYTFIIWACYNGQNGYGITSNSIIAGMPLDVPYATDFSNSQEMENRYKILDNNGDGCSWNYDYMNNTAIYVYSNVNAADDWLFTPPINYIAGHTYELSINVNSGISDQLDSLEITFGNDDEIEAQETVDDIIAVPYEPTGYSFKVTPEVSGVHFFGLHIHSPAFGGFFRLRSLEITDITEGGIADIDDSGIKARYSNGIITIDNPEKYDTTICTINGIVIMRSSAETVSAEVSNGLYIIRCGDKTQKIIAR